MAQLRILIVGLGLLALLVVGVMAFLPTQAITLFRPAPPAKSVISPEAPPAVEERAPEVESSPADGLPSPEITTPALIIKTTPGDANYAIYQDSLTELPPPATPPIRSGTVPDKVRNLPAGSYTIFLEKEGWAVERKEITVAAGEVLPIDFVFPHGLAEVTTEPEGAQIFHGERWLGKAPLTVALPLGKQELIARASDRPERTQTVTVEDQATTAVAFDMRAASRSSRARSRPTPSTIDKVGRTLKKFFAPKPTPGRRKN